MSAPLTMSRNIQLDQAVKKAKAARRKKWICFWIVSEY